MKKNISYAQKIYTKYCSFFHPRSMQSPADIYFYSVSDILFIYLPYSYFYKTLSLCVLRSFN